MGYHLVSRCVISTYNIQRVYKGPKRTFILPSNIMLQFYICYCKNCKNYYATWMLLEKLCYIKTNLNFRDPGTDSGPPPPPSQSVGSRNLFYPMSIMLKAFIKDSSYLKHLKNVKSVSNTTSSYLVSCRVIPRPATMKGWEKGVFWKIRALGNLKCSKSAKLKSR